MAPLAPLAVKVALAARVALPFPFPAERLLSSAATFQVVTVVVVALAEMANLTVLADLVATAVQLFLFQGEHLLFSVVTSQVATAALAGLAAQSVLVAKLVAGLSMPVATI